MSQITHEVRAHKEALDQILSGRRRLHVGMDRGVKPGHFIRLQEIHPKMSGDVPTGRQVFIRVSHLGDAYMTDSGKQIQEIWFQIAATENCSAQH